MWIIISIVLALTCMWLIKVNKDLVERNNKLIRERLVKEIEEDAEKLKWVLEDKED